MLLKLDTGGTSHLCYQPGDRVAIFPANRPELVDGILRHLRNAPPLNHVIQVQNKHDRVSRLGKNAD